MSFADKVEAVLLFSSKYLKKLGDPLEPDSELYVTHVGFGSVRRLSMMHIIASLA